MVCFALGWNPQNSYICCLLFKWHVVVCLALGWNPQNSYILLLLIQVACCGLSCIRLKSPEQLHFVASHSNGVLLCFALGKFTFCCFLFKWRVVVCFALGWNPQNSYILLLIIQVACCCGWNPQNSFASGWNPQNSYILLLLIQVACCGLSCIRLKDPEQFHFVASYSSGVLWFVLH